MVKVEEPVIIETKKYEDFRGWLSVSAEDFHVVQINQGYSRKKFTLRGLHYMQNMRRTSEREKKSVKGFVGN